MTGITMFDSAFNDQLPEGAAAYAAYVDGSLGSQPNYAYILSAFPDAEHLPIALFAADDAECLDVENLAASPADIPAWFARQVARGVARPVIYANVSTMEAAVVPVVQALPGARAAVRLWTAHYGAGEHICGPGTCGLLSLDADGTQWTSSAMGLVLDQSLLAADFFGTPPAPVPASAWQETAMQALPLVTQGDSDVQAVRTVQGLLCARGHTVTVDGDFGPGTLAALKAFQAMRGLTADGEAGPVTWTALMGVS